MRIRLAALVLLGLLPAGLVQAASLASTPFRAMRSLSADGTTAGSSDPGGVWRADGAFELGDFYVVYGVDGTGDTVSGYGPDPGAGEIVGLRWTAGGGSQVLDDLGGTREISYDLSADGSTAVGTAELTNGQNRPVSWDATGAITELPGIPNANRPAQAEAVSGDGSVIVGWAGDDEYGHARAVVWIDGAEPLVLPDLPDARPREPGSFELDFTRAWGYSRAEAVSDDGTFVTGVYSVLGDRAAVPFRWSEATGMEAIDPLGSDRVGVGFAISDDGKTIAGRSSSAAFVWHEDAGSHRLSTILGIAGLDTTGWDFQDIYAISSDGLTVAGVGRLSGLRTGFVATMPSTWAQVIPEPGTAGLLGLGLLGLAARRRPSAS